MTGKIKTRLHAFRVNGLIHFHVFLYGKDAAVLFAVNDPVSAETGFVH
jgi:hypothetical protein